MRQRKMWSRLFAAAAGVFALASSASAQYQPAIPPVAPGAAAPVVAQTPPPAVAGPTAPVVAPPGAGAPGAYGAGPVVVPGTGGCNGCGTATRGFTMSGGYWGSDCQYGRSGCNSGCGSFKSDNAFMFGSCKSFFAPCGPTIGGHGHGRGCGGGLFGGGHCPGAPILGRGPAGPFNPCVYDSYLNH